jgi:hypothetical protein
MWAGQLAAGDDFIIVPAVSRTGVIQYRFLERLSEEPYGPVSRLA